MVALTSENVMAFLIEWVMKITNKGGTAGEYTLVLLGDECFFIP